ncbi:MAG: hypothetical protein K2X72_12160 [Reyranella sp.]|nr:hypothetical protein [Reyranella sp.]
MTGGLLAPLSPKEEIALRRIAHGSLIIDIETTARLVALALIERTSSGLRLTPLGRLRFNALPKAPLLSRPKSIHAVNGYVEGLIEKAQSRAANKPTPESPPARPIAPASLLPEREAVTVGEDAAEDLPVYQPVYFFFDQEHWRSRADSALIRTRRTIMEHRRQMIRACDTSDRRIEASQALLKTTIPIRPSWLAAAL